MVKYDVGIDLGTANTKVFVKDEGLVLNMPSVIALKKETGKLIGIGNSAYEMIGRVPNTIFIGFPMANGVVADFELIQIFIRNLLKKAIKNYFKKIRVCLSIHSFMTDLEREAVTSSIESFGTENIFLIEESVASGIGSGFNMAAKDKALIVVNIGCGTTDMSLLSFDGIMASRAVKVGGQAIDSEMLQKISEKYGLILGKTFVEKIKIKAITVKSPSNSKKFKLKGKDKISGLPKSVTITQKDLCDLIKKSTGKIINNIQDFILDLPVETLKNVRENGILLAGGGSLIEGLADEISEKVGIKAKLAYDPIGCAICGIGRSFEMLDEFEAGFIVPA